MKKTDNQHNNQKEIDQKIADMNGSADTLAEEQEQTAVNDMAEWQDKYLRLSAEFDNYRKRTLKEKMELIEGGGVDIIKLLIPTADDFERALESMQNDHDREGIELIYQNFMESLHSRGVAEINALGEPFDVDFHEAVARIPADDQFPVGTVAEVLQKGYTMKERVIRFAKVVVAE